MMSNFNLTLIPSTSSIGAPQAALLPPAQPAILKRFVTWIHNWKTLPIIGGASGKCISPQTVPLQPHPASLYPACATREKELTALCRTWQSPAPQQDRHAARRQLVELLLPAAAAMAARYRRAIPGLTRDDLQQEAVIGLLKAMDSYNPELNVPFGAFARRRMAGATLDAVRRWAKGRRASYPVEASPAEAPGQPPPSEIESADMLAYCLAHLPQRHRKIVEMHFIHHLPRRCIAAELGLHVSRVGQLLREAAASLRDRHVIVSLLG